MTLTVHHLNNSRSQRILWLLEELELEYEIKRYERDRNARAPKSMRAVHPLGKAPILEHDGRKLIETGAIVEYVLDTLGEGRLRPAPGTDEFFRCRFFVHYAEGSLTAPLLVKLITDGMKRAPFLIRPIAKKLSETIDGRYTDEQLRTHFKYVDDELEGREWFVGDALSAADIMMSFPLEAAGSRMNVGPYANVCAFVDRVQARPAYKRAVERGGEYSFAK